MTPKFIAEICSNHNGELDRALELIDIAAHVGCKGVKFQLFRIDKLFAPEILNHPKFDYLDERRGWELPLEWLPDLKDACQSRGISFGCTPFYLEAVTELEPYVGFFKVASYELLWSDLLDKILAETNKPVAVSVGMATMAEIKEAIFYQQSKHENLDSRLLLLHCISQYPVKPKDCHLFFIGRLWLEINGIAGVGYSDHSVNAGVIFRAVHRYEADTIEFHLDLDDKQGYEYKEGHCWTPSQIMPVIQQVKDGFAADRKQYFNPPQSKDRDYRADPSDGLRPMKYMREKLREDTSC